MIPDPFGPAEKTKVRTSVPGTKSPIVRWGRAGPLRAGRSNIDFLGTLEGVVDSTPG